MGNTGASTQAMDRNTALEETKIGCIITAKDKEKLMAFKKQLLPVPYKSYKEMCDKSADLKGQRLHFQIISTANSRPYPLRFSSGVSVVQKLNVGFANTVYSTEIQHYKEQAPPPPLACPAGCRPRYAE